MNHTSTCNVLIITEECVCLTPMVDDEQLLSMSCHADHRPWQAEQFSLYSSDGEEPDHQRAGGDCCPALTQTKCPHVLPFRKVDHPLLIGVPRGEVKALQLTGEREGENTERGEINK